jgi:putative ABC transport system permease protein
MNLLENVAIGFRGLIANGLRSALTALGIFIGVLAVILGTAIGQGARTKILSSIESLGSNSIVIFPSFRREGRVGGNRARLTLKDAQVLRRECPSLSVVSPQYETNLTLKVGHRTNSLQVIASSPEYQYIRSYRLAAGKFIDERDVRGRRKVIVLGSKAATTLFGPGIDALSLIGKQVRAPGASLRVIGVLEPKGAALFEDLDSQVLVPLSTGMNTLGGGKSLSNISAATSSPEAAGRAKAEIEIALRKAHRLKANAKNDFEVLTQQQFLQLGDNTARILTLLLSGIAAVALLVGGIGIMNIMLVSVTERTREIGIRKAIGARSRDIRMQFLVEATTLSVGGGLAGIAAGAGISALIRRVFDFPAAVSPFWAITAFLVSAAIGIFFGLYPASKAAALDPIEALRYQ